MEVILEDRLDDVLVRSGSLRFQLEHRLSVSRHEDDFGSRQMWVLVKEDVDQFGAGWPVAPRHLEV